MDEDELESLATPPIDEDACRTARAAVEAARVIARRTGDDLLDGVANRVEDAIEGYRSTPSLWAEGMYYARVQRVGAAEWLERAMVELRWHLDKAMDGSSVVHLSDYGLTEEQVAMCKGRPLQQPMTTEGDWDA
jgi:hypothetical protein